MISAYSAQEGSGAANHSIPAGTTVRTVKTASHLLRRPVRSAIAPKRGLKKAIARPDRTSAWLHCAVPTAVSVWMALTK